MDKVKRLLFKAFMIAIIYNVLVLIMMIDSMELQIIIYYTGLALIGTGLYKLVNLIVDKINGRKIKSEKR